jgi:hypothetical protein
MKLAHAIFKDSTVVTFDNTIHHVYSDRDIKMYKEAQNIKQNIYSYSKCSKFCPSV